MLWGLQLNLETLSQKLTYALQIPVAVWLRHAWLKPHISQSQHSLITPRAGGESMSPVTQSSGEALKLFLPPHIPSTPCWAPRELELPPALLERAGWRIWIKQTFVCPHPNHPSFFMSTCHLQEKVQCWIIEGSHYLLEIFVNPLNGVGAPVTFDFLFFPHLSDYISVIFPFIRSS